MKPPLYGAPKKGEEVPIASYLVFREIFLRPPQISFCVICGFMGLSFSVDVESPLGAGPPLFYDYRTIGGLALFLFVY